MRAALAIVILLAAPVPAAACPSIDWDELASGGDTVPAWPSLYFHRGEAGMGALPTFVDALGFPLAYAIVDTGIPEFPIRFDFAMVSGPIYEPGYSAHHYRVDPEMTPRTRSVTTSRWNGHLEISIDSDAALLQFEEAGTTWTMALSRPMTRWFESDDVRITAIYANRTEEVIYGSPPAPVTPDRRPLVLLALLGITACVWPRVIEIGARRIRG
jgi:hypothetical protein